MKNNKLTPAILQEYVDRLANNIAFKRSFAQFAGYEKKMLIVEGSTDEEFASRVIRSDILCITAECAFSNEELMFMSEDRKSLGSKQAIVTLIYGLSVYPALINTKGIDDWAVYGMIDMDDDSETVHRNTSKLFITDTHDLETLLLSTDEKLLGRLTKCTIQSEDVKRSFYIAYQMGYLRNAIKQKDEGINLTPISASKGNIDYSAFLMDYRVSFPLLMKYILKDQNYSASAIDKTIKSYTGDKQIKKRLDGEGVWKRSINEFDVSDTEEFWRMANGHEILALICFLNESAKKAYPNSGGWKLNRDFEFDLVYNYEYENLQKTDIYSSMKKEAVVD